MRGDNYGRPNYGHFGLCELLAVAARGLFETFLGVTLPSARSAWVWGRRIYFLKNRVFFAPGNDPGGSFWARIISMETTCIIVVSGKW